MDVCVCTDLDEQLRGDLVQGVHASSMQVVGCPCAEQVGMHGHVEACEMVSVGLGEPTWGTGSRGPLLRLWALMVGLACWCGVAGLVPG